MKWKKNIKKTKKCYCDTWKVWRLKESVVMSNTDTEIINFKLNSAEELSDLSESEFKDVLNATDVSSENKVGPELPDVEAQP